MQRLRKVLRHASILVALVGATKVSTGLSEDIAVPQSTQDWKQDLAEAYGLDEPGRMMERYLLAHIDQAAVTWKAEVTACITPEAIAARQVRLKKKFLEALGEFPPRTPLRSKVVGRIVKPGYCVEKIIFESQPGVFVTAALFLPEPKQYPVPFPAMIVACGHSAEGKQYDAYQRVCALAAREGIAALIWDPIGQGERRQLSDGRGGLIAKASTHEHNAIGAMSMLLGRNTATWMIWDGMRALDYLESRSDIDSTKIGCTGNSGGGTQTSYLMALDDRIMAAAPACYVTSLYGRLPRTIGPQDAEQNIFGQLAWGMDHADYCLMRAPKPTLLCVATRDFFDSNDSWASYRVAKQAFGVLGRSEAMGLVEVNEEHGFTKPLREASVRWMLRWLKKRDEPIEEPADLEVLTAEEMRCLPQGEVMLIEGARSIPDVLRTEAIRAASRRISINQEQNLEDRQKSIRMLAGIRRIHEIPKPEITILDATADIFPQRKGIRTQPIVVDVEPGIRLPAIWCTPEQGPIRGVSMVVDGDGVVGKTIGDAVAQIVERGNAVMAVDVRGTGLTQRTGQRYFDLERHGPDGQDFYLAYLLGRSYAGMRAEDLLVMATLAGTITTLKGLESGGTVPLHGPIELVAIGEAVVPAMHAAATAPELFSSVTLYGDLEGWTRLIATDAAHVPLTSLVHGALEAYDLVDLQSIFGKPVQIEPHRKEHSK